MSLNFSFKNYLILFATVLASYLVFNIFYSSRTLPNTFFADLNISGEKYANLENLINENLNSFENTALNFAIDGQTIQTDLSSLGISFDKKRTLDEIIRVNQKNLWQLSSLKTKRTNPIYSIDFEKFSAHVNTLFRSIESAPSDATIVYERGKFSIAIEKTGDVVDKTKLALDLRNKLENLSDEVIEVRKITSSPHVREKGAQKALEKVRVLSGQKIILIFGQDKWEISGARLLELLRFSPTAYGEGYFAKFIISEEPIVFTWLKLTDSEEPMLRVNVSQEGLDEFVSEIAKFIDTPTIDATGKFEGGKVIEFTPARDGQKLDIAKTRDLVIEAISSSDIAVEKKITIRLPVAISPAKIASSEINALGIRELIASGTSYFAGSIANRIHNIKLGSSRLNGTIVGPGETFSFNNTVGEVSAATGYRQAYVISKGRTVLDDGGGICQVSTTVFRAALNAGLPIITRTAHAYRVGYYEQRGFRPGLDATVWAPAVDFQFKNDLSGYILIQALVDTSSAKLKIDIYGTKDARTVEIIEPVVSNRKPPPEDKYQEDSTIPKGTVKQVDFAAEGATVVFSRKVYLGDRILIDEKFKSNYRPWQAVYLVGTGG